jgi:hypothetical protein
MKVLRADSNGEMELSGTARELLELVRGIRSSGGIWPLDTGGDPSPYSRALASVEMRRTSGKATVRYVSNQEALEIQGGRKELELLASNIGDFAVAGDLSAHLHIEYFPGHDYLAEDSEALVIALAA